MDELDNEDPNDEAPSEEALEAERGEAEALAHALERGSGTELPEDALETAALLRYSAGEDALGDARADAILAEVFESAKVKAPSEAAPSPWLAWLKWLVPVGAFAAAGAALLLVLSEGGGPPVATELPAPGVDLLTAQARVAAEGSEGPRLGLDVDQNESQVALASAMETYRGAVLGSLSQRYGR